MSKINKSLTPKGGDLTGFTLIETVVVVIILVVVTAVIITAYSNFLAGSRMNDAVENSVATFQKARNLTLSSKDDTSGSGKIYGVHIDDKNALSPNRVVFFVPSGVSYAYSASDSNNVVYQMPSGVEIALLLTAGTNPPVSSKELYFKRITGEAQLWDPGQNKLVAATSFLMTLYSLKLNTYKSISILSTGALQIL
ncbi:MAG: hypothetical protein HYT34_02555 [Candidatus Ryanbacteria bacterium]|nr:hypothetical protein [Candidatus Ryanbacteria bacterium]